MLLVVWCLVHVAVDGVDGDRELEVVLEDFSDVLQSIYLHIIGFLEVAFSILSHVEYFIRIHVYELFGSSSSQELWDLDVLLSDLSILIKATVFPFVFCSLPDILTFILNKAYQIIL